MVKVEDQEKHLVFLPELFAKGSYHFLWVGKTCVCLSRFQEYFLMIYAERCNNIFMFLDKAQGWQNTWNFYRPSTGFGMNGKTPYEKPKTLIHSPVLLFSTFNLSEIFAVSYDSTIGFLNRGGNPAYTMCVKRFLKDPRFQICLSSRTGGISTTIPM